jgi:hypothetical protein
VFAPSRISFTGSYIVINSVYQDPVLVCVFYRKRRKRSLVYRSKNQARTRQGKRENSDCRLGAAEPFSGIEEMALRD